MGLVGVTEVATVSVGLLTFSSPPRGCCGECVHEEGVFVPLIAPHSRLPATIHHSFTATLLPLCSHQYPPSHSSPPTPSIREMDVLQEGNKGGGGDGRGRISLCLGIAPDALSGAGAGVTVPRFTQMGRVDVVAPFSFPFHQEPSASRCDVPLPPHDPHTCHNSQHMSHFRTDCNIAPYCCC